MLRICFSVSNFPFTYFKISVNPPRSDSSKIKNSDKKSYGTTIMVIFLVRSLLIHTLLLSNIPEFYYTTLMYEGAKLELC